MVNAHMRPGLRLLAVRLIHEVQARMDRHRVMSRRSSCGCHWMCLTLFGIWALQSLEYKQREFSIIVAGLSQEPQFLEFTFLKPLNLPTLFQTRFIEIRLGRSSCQIRSESMPLVRAWVESHALRGRFWARRIKFSVCKIREFLYFSQR